MSSSLSSSLSRQLEELVLICCSLLPGEQLEFLDPTSHSPGPENEATRWQNLVDAGMVMMDGEMEGLSPAKFRVSVNGATVSFEVDCRGYDGDCKCVNDCISISGDNLSRAAQEGWREAIKDKLKVMAEEGGGDFPLYQLLSLQLLPLLHEEVENKANVNVAAPQEPVLLSEQTYHALFTSHHLISPTKRRNLQGWSSSLKISGFAKVGYPGVIYAQGPEDSVEAFVENVKAMQWLALKVRFVEPLEGEGTGQLKGWKEFEKVGEVVEEMRRLGREKYVLEMGIGAGT